MNARVKLLIVGASNKSTRSIAKSLRKYHCDSYVLTDTDLAVSKSRFVQRYLYRPEIRNDIHLFKDEIIAAIREYGIRVVLPSTDMAVAVILQFRAEIEQYATIIGLNPENVYRFAHNKYDLAGIAAEIGLKTPHSIYVDSLTENTTNWNELHYPVVVKPVSSIRILHNKCFDYKVTIAQHPEELINTLRELVPGSPVMVQEFIGGYGIGYNVFCVDGEIQSEYIHQRLNEHGGVSSYRNILPIDTYGIREKIHQLIKRIGWNGVAMVEFKVDDHNVPYLMEMNGRFFGSTELGVKAGYDFPGLLYSHQFMDQEPQPRIRREHCSLRLLHDEVLLEYAALLKTRNISRFLRWKWSLMNLILPGNFLEDNLFNDPAFVFNLYRYDWKRVAAKRRQHRLIQQVQLRSVQPEELREAQHIAFVCMGNICRSPFAARYAQEVFPEKTIVSTGTFPLENRYSPMEALSAAQKNGMDLSSHQSCYIGSLDLSQIDLFIVMDKRNAYDLLEMGIPEEKIAALSPEEIPDPYRKSEQVFEQTYRRIGERIDQLQNNN